jgi:predicted dehydrogenase
LIDPKLRGVEDVCHQVTAAASSISKDRAEEFKTKVKLPADCAAYGSYKELFQASNVDIIYVASPHSHHFQHVMMAFEAGKHVMCEKPITVNAAQAKKLYRKAAKKKLFLLDAVWTRYFPLSIQIRELIKAGVIGEVLRTVADLSEGNDLDEWYHKKHHRKLQMNLAGGALLEGQLSGESLTFTDHCSRHLLCNVDLSESLPHPSKGAAKASVENFVNHCHLQ